MGPYCFAAYFGYAVLFIALQQLIGRHRGATNTKKREAPGFYLFSLISIGFLLASTSSISHQPVRNVPLIIGGAIVFVGLGISMWSQWELGSNWVGGIGLHKKHQLITSGPYRFVRHPLYSGMLVS